MTPTAREHADDKTIRKERYEAVLGVADANTAPNQQPGVRPQVLKRMAMNHSAFRLTDDERDELGVCLKTVRAAVENGDLFRWEDTHEGVTRYTPATVENLQGIVAYQNTRDTPDTDCIERVVDRLDEVRG